MYSLGSEGLDVHRARKYASLARLTSYNGRGHQLCQFALPKGVAVLQGLADLLAARDPLTECIASKRWNSRA